MHQKRKLVQYAVGLLVMALGIVLIKKGEIGVSPISAIPTALTNFLPLTFGNTTILFQIACFLLIPAIQRKIHLKSLLTLPVAILFGSIIDLYMSLISFPPLPLWLRYIVCLAGIAGTALGIVLIVGADLMLPSPDALLCAISAQYHQPLSRIKMAGDATYVILAVLIQWIVLRRPLSPDCVWVGTILSVLLTGRLVGMFSKWLPWLDSRKVASPPSDRTNSPLPPRINTKE